ncbi:MAG TPA: hypothetical protein PKV98_04615 [Burkholderiaceae bacterium]|nr:hypothetical protein [Burkholderiaceae bacterium]
MRKLYADLIQEQTTTAGVGTVTLVQVPGWVRFSDRLAVGELSYYMIENGLNKEVGIGTVGAANTLARTTILGTLVAGVATWSGATAIALVGTSTVRAVAAEHFLATLLRANYTAVNVNFAMVDGGSYGVTVSGLTGTLPASPQTNDRIQVFQAEAGIVNTVINPNGSKINGVAGNMTVDIDGFDFWLVYTGASYGWKME